MNKPTRDNGHVVGVNLNFQSESYFQTKLYLF